MILSYKECMEKYGNDYQLSKVMESGAVYKLEEGIYSDDRYESDLAVIMKKHRKGILTGDFAFYFHNLTDVIPDVYDLATGPKDAPIQDARIKQVYTRADLLPLGRIEAEYEGATVRIYGKERMLIELLRNKNKMPYDLYKEILNNYRRIIDDLEIWRIQEYADIFPKSKMIKKALREEVM